MPSNGCPITVRRQVHARHRDRLGSQPMLHSSPFAGIERHCGSLREDLQTGLCSIVDLARRRNRYHPAVGMVRRLQCRSPAPRFDVPVPQRISSPQCLAQPSCLSGQTGCTPHPSLDQLQGRESPLSIRRNRKKIARKPQQSRISPKTITRKLNHPSRSTA